MNTILCIIIIFLSKIILYVSLHPYYGHMKMLNIGGAISILTRKVQPNVFDHACPLASSPAPSQLFSLAGTKRERVWDLKSRDKCWQNGVALALPQSVNFKPVWRLRSIKRSSARPLRIVLPSLTVSVAFFFTHIEPERS